MKDPAKFERHGLAPETVLNQAMSGLSHLHSLNIGKIYFFCFFLLSLSFVRLLENGSENVVRTSKGRVVYVRYTISSYILPWTVIDLSSLSFWLPHVRPRDVP